MPIVISSEPIYLSRASFPQIQRQLKLKKQKQKKIVYFDEVMLICEFCWVITLDMVYSVD